MPLDAKGAPDEAKAKEIEFVPQDPYFADLDNEGDTDVIFGVHSDWQRFDEQHMKWIDVPEADPGVRSATGSTTATATSKRARRVHHGNSGSGGSLASAITGASLGSPGCSTDFSHREDARQHTAATSTRRTGEHTPRSEGVRTPVGPLRRDLKGAVLWKRGRIRSPSRVHLGGQLGD